jgi:methionyl-tRNA formyltransferase
MGRILMQEAIPIGAEETAGELHDRMKSAGAALLVKTVAGLAGGELKGIPQQEWIPPVPLDLTVLRPAPKIDTSTCLIDWNKSVTQVFNLVRGLSPSPAAFTTVGGKTLKIFSATRESANPAVDPGVLQVDGKTRLRIACRDGWLIPLDVQMEGRKRMPVSEFLKGFRME